MMSNEIQLKSDKPTPQKVYCKTGQTVTFNAQVGVVGLRFEPTNPFTESTFDEPVNIEEKDQQTGNISKHAKGEYVYTYDVQTDVGASLLKVASGSSIASVKPDKVNAQPNGVIIIKD